MKARGQRSFADGPANFPQKRGGVPNDLLLGLRHVREAAAEAAQKRLAEKRARVADGGS